MNYKLDTIKTISVYVNKFRNSLFKIFREAFFYNRAFIM